MVTLISTPAQLQGINLNSTTLAGDYELANDIDMSGFIFTSIGSQLHGEFTGSLDGKGFTISNLSFTTPRQEHFGLFGKILNATLKNINMTNFAITNTYGSSIIGGLVGRNDNSLIEYCNIEGVINDSGPCVYLGGLLGYGDGVSCIVRYSSANVIINTSTNGNMGGFVGNFLQGTIKECFSEGSVNITGSDQYNPGGFAGHIGWGLVSVSAIVQNCYCRGACNDFSSSGAAGGFYNTAANLAQIINCFSTGAVNTPGGGFGQTNYGTIINCFWDVNTSGQADSWGEGVGKTTAQMKTQSTFAGYDFTTKWGIDPTKNDGYPYLQAFYPVPPVPPTPTPVKPSYGSGTRSDPYIIQGINNLNYLRTEPYAHYALGNDIDASSTATWRGGLGWEQITDFYGTLDGRGYKITGLKMLG